MFPGWFRNTLYRTYLIFFFTDNDFKPFILLPVFDDLQILVFRYLRLIFKCYNCFEVKNIQKNIIFYVLYSKFLVRVYHLA
jgi:hypothetical protein